MKLASCAALALFASVAFANRTSDWSAYISAETQARNAAPSAAPALYGKAAQLLSTYLNRYFTAQADRVSGKYAIGLFALGNDYWSSGDYANAQKTFGACANIPGAVQVIVNGQTLKNAAIQSRNQARPGLVIAPNTSISITSSKG